MGSGRARLAASIADADLGNLAFAIRRAEKAGADRIHLDITDGHFVPELTFGAGTVSALRRRTSLPFDAHLMVTNPGVLIEKFIAAGCDSITIQVELDEPIEPTLRAIRSAGRAAGLALRPATPPSALEPYRPLYDIVLVMTAEPLARGAPLLKEVARAKLLPARTYIAHAPVTGEVHVEGGVNRETAEFIGAHGADILVAGWALFRPGANMAREVRLIKVLADEGYQYGLNDGRPPIPRDNWVTFAQLPKHLALPFAAEIEAGGIPVVTLRASGQVNPDGVRDYDLMVPAPAEGLTVERHALVRAAREREAEAWRQRIRGGPGASADGG